MQEQTPRDALIGNEAQRKAAVDFVIEEIEPLAALAEEEKNFDAVEAYTQIVDAIQNIRYDAFDFLHARGYNNLVRPIDKVLATTGFNMLKRAEALAKGQPIGISCGYRDPRDDAEHRWPYIILVNITPTFRDGIFVIGHVSLSGNDYDSKSAEIVPTMTPLEKIARDFGVKIGAPFPHEINLSADVQEEQK